VPEAPTPTDKPEARANYHLPCARLLIRVLCLGIAYCPVGVWWVPVWRAVWMRALCVYVPVA
jgi:hypothetical protein